MLMTYDRLNINVGGHPRIEWKNCKTAWYDC